ncbi:MAG: restriction endonuclease subunit M, partial [Desulfobacterales bacterium PC51MH44]
MQPLEKSLRNKLEKTIKDARDIAEDAARAALEQLGVGEPSAYPHLTEADRKLRRKLRAHGRQLGNGRNAKGEQALDRLIEEVAYEHWHRMLFARFLAENNLLMYPDPDDPVAVTLEECEDLAADEGASNGWELASRYAARMLPQIFRPDSPVFQLTLPPEHQQKLERLIADLSQGVFTASDSLGWVYQFWQAKKKDEINASEVKIGARELPAVTQLFTEPYMVSFLLDNSLGAWWAARRLSEKALKTATSEEELRRKAAIPGVPLDYLRFVQQDDGSWTPAAGTFDGWPEQLSELKTIDPCCGSGHFFVAAFLMLVPMRMEREGLSARQAVDRVLSENIHGLELDQRCVELAAFALALTAWKYPNAGGYRLLPELNVACSGLVISAKKEEWLALAGDNTNLRLALEEIYKQFKDAPVLGSLIDPKAGIGKGSLFEKWEDIGPLLTKALSGEKDDEKVEMGVVAQDLSKAAKILVQKFDWVITNVPYLALGKQSPQLKSFCEKEYKKAKNDLATVFLERCLSIAVSGGNVSIVLPQNWLFLKRYQKLRILLLKQKKWLSVLRLGAGAFHTITGEVVKAILVSMDNKQPYVNHNFFAIDVSNIPGAWDKADQIKSTTVNFFNQQQQLKNPESRVVIDDLGVSSSLDEYAIVSEGLHTGDYPRFGRKFWEFLTIAEGWTKQQGGATSQSFESGMEHILYWENGSGELTEFIEKRLGGSPISMWVKGDDVWGKSGLCIGSVGDLKCTRYTGWLFTHGIYAVVSKKPEQLPALKAFCESTEFLKRVRMLDQKMAVARTSIAKVAFDYAHWTKVAAKKYPNGLPKAYSDNPTQWIFHGHPCGSVVWDEEKKWTTISSPRTDATVLQVAIARLLGYRWPVETDPDMELSDESRAWVKKSQKLLSFADEDGIVSIPPVRGEMRAEDRLEILLAAAYGSEWSSNKKAELLAQAGHAGKTLETWLRDKFFTQHCKLFHHRPFIWHIWDGLRDGFAALVNYHKLDAKLLETLIYTYLGDWISRQKQGIGNGVDGAQGKLAAAEALKKKLELILEGEVPYDIFVCWKNIEKQSIGWNPDLNDGIRLNIRPFMTVPDVGKKGAGILRDRPNIKWMKDRGKDMASAPW